MYLLIPQLSPSFLLLHCPYPFPPPPPVADLIYWRDMQKSAAIFTSSLLLLFSLSYFSSPTPPSSPSLQPPPSGSTRTSGRPYRRLRMDTPSSETKCILALIGLASCYVSEEFGTNIAVLISICFFLPIDLRFFLHAY